MAITPQLLRDVSDLEHDSLFMANLAEKLLMANFAVPEVARVLEALNSSSSPQGLVRPVRESTGQDFSIQQPANAGDVQDGLSNQHGNSISG